MAQEVTDVLTALNAAVSDKTTEEIKAYYIGRPNVKKLVGLIAARQIIVNVDIVGIIRAAKKEMETSK